MPQKYNPTVPVFKSPLVSAEMRDQLTSLDSCHSGASAPPHAVEGKLWFRTTDYSFRQYMFGAWRVIFRFDPSTGVVVFGSDFGGYRTAVEPTGAKNGVNDTFTLPSGESYHPGTLAVLLNGQQYNPANIQQNGPGYTTFTIINGDTLPDSDDVLSITYLVK